MESRLKPTDRILTMKVNWIGLFLRPNGLEQPNKSTHRAKDKPWNQGKESHQHAIEPGHLETLSGSADPARVDRFASPDQEGEQDEENAHKENNAG
jgi:hypothetical protein